MGHEQCVKVVFEGKMLRTIYSEVQMADGM